MVGCVKYRSLCINPSAQLGSQVGNIHSLDQRQLGWSLENITRAVFNQASIPSTQILWVANLGFIYFLQQPL